MRARASRFGVVMAMAPHRDEEEDDGSEDCGLESEPVRLQGQGHPRYHDVRCGGHNLNGRSVHKHAGDFLKEKIRTFTATTIGGPENVEESKGDAGQGA